MRPLLLFLLFSLFGGGGVVADDTHYQLPLEHLLFRDKVNHATAVHIPLLMLNVDSSAPPGARRQSLLFFDEFSNAALHTPDIVLLMLNSMRVTPRNVTIRTLLQEAVVDDVALSKKWWPIWTRVGPVWSYLDRLVVAATKTERKLVARAFEEEVLEAMMLLPVEALPAFTQATWDNGTTVTDVLQTLPTTTFPGGKKRKALWWKAWSVFIGMTEGESRGDSPP